MAHHAPADLENPLIVEEDGRNGCQEIIWAQTLRQGRVQARRERDAPSEKRHT
jgi:hypothetical protein